MGDLQIDFPVAFHLGEVAHTAQKGIRYTGRTAATTGYLAGCFLVDLDVQQSRRTLDDTGEDVGIVIFEVTIDAETGTEGRGEQTGTGGSTDEGEMVQVYLDRTCGRTLIDHDIDTVILHGRVQVFFHHRAQPMDLIDEKDIVGFERGKETGQVTGFIEYRS